MFWWFDWAPTKWPLVPGRTNFVMEIQLGLWEGLFCMRFFQWWYLFWVSFFGKHLRRLSLVSDGGDGWLHFTSMLLPDRVCLVSYPQMLKTTGGRRGMTRNDKDEGCCYPTPQATNKRLDAFLPLQLGKKKEISFDHKSMKKPKLTYHVTQNKGFHKWTQRTYQTPNIWKHIAARKAKLPKIPMFATQKHSTFQAPQKNSWLFPAPWNKYCQTSKVPLSMVHQSQIDPNCICPQYEHQTMLRCPYHWSPGHHHAKRWWLWFFYCCELKYIVILYWEEQKDEGAKFQFVELNSNPKASWKQTISMMIPPKNWSGNVWKSNKSSLTTSLFSFSALGWKISRRWSMPLSPSGRRPTSRVWPSDGRCFPCNNPVVPKNTVDGRNPANQLRLVVYPIIFRLLYIPGGAGFLPSTVLAWYLLNTLLV